MNNPLTDGYSGPPQIGIAFAIQSIQKHFAPAKPKPVTQPTPIGDVALLIIRDMDDQWGVEVPVLVNIMDYRDGEVQLGDACVCDDVPPHFTSGEIVNLTPMERERAQNLWAFNEDKTVEDMQMDAVRDRWDNQ